MHAFELAVSLSGEIPLLVRRGGCATNKKWRSLRSGADGVVSHRNTFNKMTTPSGGFAVFS